MYAPSILGDVTVTVTSEIASALINSAGLGEARDDCWQLRDGTTTIVARSALTDALVVIAEGTTETAQTPSARREAPASPRSSQQARTSAKGSSPIRDFLLKTLDHEAIIDEVTDLLSEQLERTPRLSPGTITDDLRSILYRAIGEASFDDWYWVADTLSAEACETLGIEHPLDRTPPGVETPHRPDARTGASRNLDPGVLRERLATIYAHGASRGARLRARWIVRLISRLTGLSREVVEADAKADAEAMSELIHADRDSVSSEDRGSAQAATSTSVSCWPLRRLSGREAEALLEKGTDSTDPAIRLRCGVILAVNAGVSPSHLAMTRQTSVEHIIRIVSEFNERGLSSVEDSR